MRTFALLVQLAAAAGLVAGGVFLGCLAYHAPNKSDAALGLSMGCFVVCLCGAVAAAETLDEMKR